MHGFQRVLAGENTRENTRPSSWHSQIHHIVFGSGCLLDSAAHNRGLSPACWWYLDNACFQLAGVFKPSPTFGWYFIEYCGCPLISPALWCKLFVQLLMLLIMLVSINLHPYLQSCGNVSPATPAPSPHKAWLPSKHINEQFSCGSRSHAGLSQALGVFKFPISSCSLQRPRQDAFRCASTTW